MNTVLFYDCLSGTQECGCLWDFIIIWKSDSDLCEQNFLRIISFLNFQIQQRGEQQSAQTINNCNTSDPSSAQGDLLKGIVICLGVARSVVQSPVRASHSNFCNTFFKVEKILKGSLDLIPSPSPSLKIQIMGGKVCFRCKGKTLLGVVNKLLKTISLPSLWKKYTLP